MKAEILMDQTIIKLGRVFFVLMFMVLAAGILYVDIFFLMERSGRPKTTAIRYGKVEPDSKVIIGSFNEKEEGVEEVSIKTADARPEILKKYLAKYKSPLLPYAGLIVELSDTYNFDYYWIPAIAQQESNLCKKIPEGSHNCWGYGIHKKGTLKFENYELALRSYAEYLKREYFDKGLDTPELIMRKYCPSSNGSWAFGVKKFSEQLTSGNF